MSLITQALRQIEETQPKSLHVPVPHTPEPEPTALLKECSAPATITCDSFPELNSPEALQQHRDLIEAIRPLDMDAHSTVFVSSDPSLNIARLVIRLALLWSQENHQSILLLDCDQENAALSNVYSLADSPGVLQLLQQTGNCQELIFSTNTPNISVVPIGYPSHALHCFPIAAATRHLLATLGELYPTVLIHAGGAHSALAQSFVCESEKTILAIPEGRDHLAQAEKTADSLRQMNANLAGCAVLKIF